MYNQKKIDMVLKSIDYKIGKDEKHHLNVWAFDFFPIEIRENEFGEEVEIYAISKLLNTTKLRQDESANILFTGLCEEAEEYLNGLIEDYDVNGEWASEDF